MVIVLPLCKEFNYKKIAQVWHSSCDTNWHTGIPHRSAQVQVAAPLLAPASYRWWLKWLYSCHPRGRYGFPSVEFFCGSNSSVIGIWQEQADWRYSFSLSPPPSLPSSLLPTATPSATQPLKINMFKIVILLLCIDHWDNDFFQTKCVESITSTKFCILQRTK